MSNHSGSYMLNEADLEIGEIPVENPRWGCEVNYIVIHKPTNYKSKVYFNKEDALSEIKRYLNDEFLK